MERHEKYESFECTICSFTFRKEEVYLKHRLYHTGERKHLCPTCFQAFETKDNFKKHLERHDVNKAKQFSCKTCSKRLKTNYNLKYHNEMVHEGQRNFSRGACGRELTTLQSLKGHEEKCKLETKQITQKLSEVLEIKMRNIKYEIWIILMGRARGYK